MAGMFDDLKANLHLGIVQGYSPEEIRAAEQARARGDRQGVADALGTGKSSQMVEDFFGHSPSPGGLFKW